MCRLRALEVPGAEYAAEQLRRNGIDGSCLRTIELTDDNLRFAFGIDNVVERAGVLQGACPPTLCSSSTTVRSRGRGLTHVGVRTWNSPARLGQVRPHPLRRYGQGFYPCWLKTPVASRCHGKPVAARRVPGSPRQRSVVEMAGNSNC